MSDTGEVKDKEGSTVGYYFDGVKGAVAEDCRPSAPNPEDYPFANIHARADLQAIEADRQQHYGDPLTCQQNIALAWNAILGQQQGRPITAYTVALMFAAAKIVRLAHAYKEDSQLDALVYLEFAKRFHGES